ncbi:MAG TPA: polyprenyl synthetase family protein, partial [Candidatus Methylacidiphilales bacterium]
LQAAADTGAGEVGDLVLGTRDLASLPAAEIEQVFHLKTTRYTFEAPLALGAILAGAAERDDGAVLLDLARIAEPLGLAFQIGNDLADFAGEGLDLVSGKRTLLLHLAHAGLPETEQALLRLALGLPGADPSRLPILRDLVAKSGAPALLERRRGALRRQAREELDRAFAHEAAIHAGFAALLDSLDALDGRPARPC